SGFFPVSLAQVLDSFTFTPASLFTAFAEGLFITYLTILLTSWRVSKLNIIRAVRDIPEPPRGVRTYTRLLFLGISLAIIGVALFEASYAAKSAIEALVGPSLVIFGAGLILARFLLNRYAFTLTGIALLVQWGVPSFSFNSSIIQDSGGYDVVTQTTLPVANLAAQIAADTSLKGKVAAVIPFNSTGVTVVRDLTSRIDLGPQLAVGGDPNALGESNFFTGNTFSMVQMAEGYQTPAEVWNAVTADNSTNVVWSLSLVNNRGPPTAAPTPEAGDLLQLFWVPDNGKTTVTKEVTVAGVLNGVFFGGIVGTSQFLQQSFGIVAGQFGFVKVTPGTDPTAVSNTLKRDFARVGMQTIAIAPLSSDCR